MVKRAQLSFLEWIDDMPGRDCILPTMKRRTPSPGGTASAFQFELGFGRNGMSFFAKDGMVIV